MFASLGNIVYRFRFAVIAIMFVLLGGLGAFGLTLNDHLSQSGYDDPTSASSHAAQIRDNVWGRDHSVDVIAIYSSDTKGGIDAPEFRQKVVDSGKELLSKYPDQIDSIGFDYFTSLQGGAAANKLADPDHTKGLVFYQLKGNDDTTVANNFRTVRDAFAIPGIKVELAGLQPVFGTINDTMNADVHRMELLAIPAVGVLLFFVFGGLVAAALPLVIGGLTVVGAWGVVRLFTNFTEVNTFVSPVVSLIGLGLAIDYGLFIVSRFREELAEGYETRDAVRRTVMTAGRTVVFSATMIVASLGGLLLFPQNFLKSVAYGAIATVTLAALAAITILPALLGILGRRIDSFGLKAFRKTKTADEIEASIWGRLTRWVMRNPLKVTIPIVVGLLLLIIPVSSIKFGGISEKYLPPDNSTRMAQEQVEELFPTYPTSPIILLVEADSSNLSRALGNATQIATTASKAPDLLPGNSFSAGAPKVVGTKAYWQMSAGINDPDNPSKTIDYLRAMPVPDGMKVMVTGTPTLQQDSIDTLLQRLPIMIILVVLLTFLLMFLSFGSVVLPIKAALMTALGLGSTLGILTWIFIDGHGSGILNFTPGPISSPVLVLIIAIIYGLSTDYEVFLLSRMVEARARGASTTEAVRVGTSHTGRIITAAALILIVVTGAFAFSELVMMQYIAYGMIAALIIDATFIRMFLVPAVMKLLGDDCWWAPQWMKRLQHKIGLGEPILDDERIPQDVPNLVVGAGGRLAPEHPVPQARAQSPAPAAFVPAATPQHAGVEDAETISFATVSGEPPAARPHVAEPPLPDTDESDGVYESVDPANGRHRSDESQAVSVADLLKRERPE